MTGLDYWIYLALSQTELIFWTIRMFRVTELRSVLLSRSFTAGSSAGKTCFTRGHPARLWLPVKNDQSRGVLFKSIKTGWETSWSSLTTDHRAFLLAFTEVPGEIIFSEKDKMLNRLNNFYIGRARLNAKWREFWKFQIVKIKNTNWTIDGCNKCTLFQFKKFYFQYWNVEKTLEIIIIITTMEAYKKQFPVGSFKKKIKVINPLESEVLWPLSGEASCVRHHMTPGHQTLVTLVGEITGASDLAFIGWDLLSSVCYQFEVMANRPHQSLIYRITDADTGPDLCPVVEITLGGPRSLSSTAETWWIFMTRWRRREGGGGGGGSFLVIFRRGPGAVTGAGREKSD